MDLDNGHVHLVCLFLSLTSVSSHMAIIEVLLFEEIGREGDGHARRRQKLLSHWVPLFFHGDRIMNKEQLDSLDQKGESKLF